MIEEEKFKIFQETKKRIDEWAGMKTADGKRLEPTDQLLCVLIELLIEIKDKLTTGAVEVYGSVTVDGDVTVHEPR